MRKGSVLINVLAVIVVAAVLSLLLLHSQKSAAPSPTRVAVASPDPAIPSMQMEYPVGTTGEPADLPEDEITNRKAIADKDDRDYKAEMAKERSYGLIECGPSEIRDLRNCTGYAGNSLKIISPERFRVIRWQMMAINPDLIGPNGVLVTVTIDGRQYLLTVGQVWHGEIRTLGKSVVVDLPPNRCVTLQELRLYR